MAGPWVSMRMPTQRLRRGGGGADVLDDAPRPVVRRMGHVESKNIEAGVNELAEHFRRIRGGAERGDDFGLSHDVQPRSRTGGTDIRRECRGEKRT